MSNTRIRVLCVDDHPLVREGIESMIRWQDDLELVATAATGEQALDLFHRVKPDVTLMDLQLPGMTGLEVITSIRAQDGLARIIVLTMYERYDDIVQALQAGATTYLLKDVSCDDLADIIRKVHSGERPLPAHVKRRMGEAVAEEAEDALTARELDVIRLMAEGMRNSEIAGALGIGAETAKMHVRNVLTKLHVHNRTAAIAAAMRRGIIRSP